jgi:hypothetical protein
LPDRGNDEWTPSLHLLLISDEDVLKMLSEIAAHDARTTALAEDVAAE